MSVCSITKKVLRISEIDLISNPPHHFALRARWPPTGNGHQLMLNIVANGRLKAIIICCTFVQSYFYCCLWSEVERGPELSCSLFAGTRPLFIISGESLTSRGSAATRMQREEEDEVSAGVCTFERSRWDRARGPESRAERESVVKNLPTKIRRPLWVSKLWLHVCRQRLTHLPVSQGSNGCIQDKAINKNQAARYFPLSSHCGGASRPSSSSAPKLSFLSRTLAELQTHHNRLQSETVPWNTAEVQLPPLKIYTADYISQSKYKQASQFEKQP